MRVGVIARGDIVYALDLASELSDAGVSVTLYLWHSHVVKIVGTSDQPIRRLYEQKILPKTCKVRLMHLPRMRNPRSFTLFRRLSKTIRNDGVELAHILLGPGELWFAVLACLLRNNMPVTSTMIVPRPNAGGELPFFIVWAVHKLLVYGSDMVIVNGKDQVELVQKLYRIPISRVAFVPVSVGATAIKCSAQKSNEESGTVLFFGRAHPHKGLEYLIKAQPIITCKVPHARILISAHGKDLERCRQMIQDRTKFEIHEGSVPSKLMAVFFQRASLVALPYLSAASSGVLTTAYVFGKPVVASNISGLSEYVEDGVTGLLVPPSDEEQLASAIVRLLSNKALRHRMGENAKRLMNEEQKKITKQTIRVYEKAISIHKNS
jgi:glycosyltransferase involved in cell wall biosynthesis